MNIYEIDQQVKEIEDKILQWAEENEGDITNCPFEIELDSLDLERNDKIISLGVWVKNLLAESEAIKREKDELAKRQKAIESKAGRIKSYIKDCIPTGEKITDPKVVFSWRKSKSTRLLDGVQVSDLPVEFQKITIAEDKTAIKKELANEDSKLLEFAEIVENQNLQIK